MKKIFALILAIMMLISIVACQNPQTGDSQSTNDVTDGKTQGGTSQGDDQAPQLELPEKNLDGFAMTILRSSNYFIEKGVFSESEMSGDQVSDAVFKRNAQIEKKYNCKIELLPTVMDHPSHEIQQYIASNDGAVDMLLDGGAQIAHRAQYFCDLNKLEYFDFSKPWWNQELNEGLSISDKLFLTVGDYQISAKQNVYHVIFNKDVAKDLNIDPESLYQLVYDDQWTLDKMSQLAKKAPSDLNGDTLVDIDDRFGVMGELYNNWTLALGAGVHIIEKDNDDLPILSVGSERNIDVFDQLIAFTGDQQVTLYAERIPTNDRWSQIGRLRLTPDRWLFYVGSLTDGMRTFENEYGVLPSPKYDEHQDRYYHDASLGNSPVTAIPVCATDSNKVAFILEAMSYYSYKEVIPVFYDEYLNTKLVRDPESVEMLEIIHDSMYFDLGAMMGWGRFHKTLANMGNQNQIATEYASMKVVAETEMKDYIDKILALEN